MEKPRFIRMDDPRFIPEFIKAMKDPDRKREFTPEELKEIYAAYKEQFTVEDLLEYLQPWDDAVPMEELLEELQKKEDAPRDENEQ